MASNTMGTPGTEGYQEQLDRRPAANRIARRANPVGNMDSARNQTSAAAMVQSTDVVSPRDRVRWGPIWAGLLTTLTSFMILEFLGIGLGLISTANGNAGATSGISTGIAGLIAFFLGGWVAESVSLARGGSAGLLNGFLVWALGVMLILVLSVFGLSQLFGAIGNIGGQFISSGHTINTPGVSVSSTQVANVTQSAGWAGFVGMVITAAAAALGGWVSSHGNPLGRVR